MASEDRTTLAFRQGTSDCTVCLDFDKQKEDVSRKVIFYVKKLQWSWDEGGREDSGCYDVLNLLRRAVM